ncbi:uncharacterized protein LOC127792868 isoform X2 [Diospyros lotus]|uniref:uncharacterized protein LOC127792868 isoform X2 n=1 Tax=Diospyros lotus TaxID=55363 RepID=UPI002251B0F5|nr:uncharacterized protein LOC127792868 isoform X2 [Diospyros lotus]
MHRPLPEAERPSPISRHFRGYGLQVLNAFSLWTRIFETVACQCDFSLDADDKLEAVKNRQEASECGSFDLGSIISRDMNTDELIEKFSKYEADYTQRLMAKYFSDKDIFGGNVFEQSTKVDGETIKASRRLV